MTTDGKRSGRRPGRPDTRQDILNAARVAFAADGYDRTSIRRIATDAGVDPALIHHYFATKDRLFLAAIEAPFIPSELISQVAEGDFATFGRRLVATFVQIWDGEIGERAQAFLRSVIAHPDRRTLVNDFVLTQILREALGHAAPDLDHAETRGSLVASQLLGLALTRNMFQLPPLQALTPEQIVRIYAPTIQRYLTAEAAELGLTLSPE
ncbi:TetR family transcriptional regulator [Stackebrandtia soli]|uniref:TetR/AcrR family transcriptional regulator n=1 Tax=Stackebrandtia soli TaxID=1892856 RepID=UPI0039EA9E0A